MRPSSRRMVRVASRAIGSLSVTTTNVVPEAVLISRIRASSSRAVVGSTWPVGSSASTIGRSRHQGAGQGHAAQLAAGELGREVVGPAGQADAIEHHRRRGARFSSFSMPRGSERATMSIAVLNRRASMCRCIWAKVARHELPALEEAEVPHIRAFTQITPAVGFSIPAIMRRSEDLPEPGLAGNTQEVPRGIARLMLVTATDLSLPLPKAMVTPRSSICSMSYSTHGGHFNGPRVPV